MDDVGGRPRARLEVPAVDGRLSVRLSGELDVASLADVESAVDRLLALPAQPVCIDVADLAFLDSTGLAVLIRIANHFGTVELIHAAPIVRRIVEALGLSDYLGLAGS